MPASVRDRRGVVWYVGVAAASGLVFVAGLAVTEPLGEVAVDVDLKPFFLPVLPATLLPYGMTSRSVASGAAVGEALLDVLEGYEVDDPFGFLGYVAGFLAFAWIVHRVAPAPTDRRWLVVAALVGALVQAAFEGLAFLLVGGVGPAGAAASVAGNTLTHGLLVGALPLIALVAVVESRVRAVGDA